MPARDGGRLYKDVEETIDERRTDVRGLRDRGNRRAQVTTRHLIDVAGLDPRIAFAISDIGGRDAMEDTHVLEIESAHPLRILGGVFDGHGTDRVAQLAKARFPAHFRAALGQGAADAFRSAYAAVDRESEGMPGGTVAATFYADERNVVVANVGDAHVVSVSQGTAVQLTEDHRLTNERERERVVAAGATIWGAYVCLDDGSGLMPTRTLGDHAFREVGVLAEPTVSSHPMGTGLLVAACDGLWDVMQIEELPDVIGNATTAKLAAERLAQEALRVRRTLDNLTVLVVRVSGEQ